MKARQFIIPLVVFLLGMICTIIGALFKIQHWPYGREILIVGSAIEVLALLVLILFLSKHYLSK